MEFLSKIILLVSLWSVSRSWLCPLRWRHNKIEINFILFIWLVPQFRLASAKVGSFSITTKSFTNFFRTKIQRRRFKRPHRPLFQLVRPDENFSTFFIGARANIGTPPDTAKLFLRKKQKNAVKHIKSRISGRKELTFARKGALTYPLYMILGNYSYWLKLELKRSRWSFLPHSLFYIYRNRSIIWSETATVCSKGEKQRRSQPAPTASPHSV